MNLSRWIRPFLKRCGCKVRLERLHISIWAESFAGSVPLLLCSSSLCQYDANTCVHAAGSTHSAKERDSFWDDKITTHPSEKTKTDFVLWTLTLECALKGRQRLQFKPKTCVTGGGSVYMHFVQFLLWEIFWNTFGPLTSCLWFQKCCLTLITAVSSVVSAILGEKITNLVQVASATFVFRTFSPQQCVNIHMQASGGTLVCRNRTNIFLPSFLSMCPAVMWYNNLHFPSLCSLFARLI